MRNLNLYRARSETPEPRFKDSSTLSRYRKELNYEKYHLERLYENYFIEPAKHPKYRKEWNKFYDVRSAQLERKGIDPEKFDFTDEWRDFFLSRLNILKAKDLITLKCEMYQKYSEKDGKEGRSRKPRGIRSRTRSSSYSDSSSSRYSGKQSFSSHGYSSSSRRHSLSSSHVYLPDIKNDSTDGKQLSVSTICLELKRLDRYIFFNRSRVTKLMNKALEHEKLHNREYLINKEECDFLKNIISILRNSLMVKKMSRSSSDKVKEVCSKLEILVRTWDNFMRDLLIQSKQYSNISPTSSWEREVEVSKNIKTEKQDSLTSSGYNSASTSIPSEIQPIVNRLEYFMKHRDEQKFIKTEVKSEPIEYFPLKIKEEKLEYDAQSSLQLMEEKNELLRKIYEASEFPNLLVNAGRVEMTNNAGANMAENSDYSIAVKKEGNMTARTISDSELILNLKVLETLSEEMQACIYQIMIDIEQNDKERFNRLKNYIYEEDQM